MQVHAFRRTQAVDVDLVDKVYNFKPNEAGHVVCEVPEGAHLKRLLSITEAYRPYEPSFDLATFLAASKGAAPAAATTTSTSTDDDEDDADNAEFTKVLKGSPDLPATFEIAPGVEVTQAQAVEAAFAVSGMTREAWNLNDDDDREGLIEQEVTRLRIAEEQKAQAAAEAAQAEELARQQAEAQKAEDRPADPPPAPSNPFVLQNGEETVDLAAMTVKEVREFAAANGVTLPGGNSTKADDLRAMVVKALTGA